MTPCEERDYKIGQIFRVVGDTFIFNTGSLVALSYDDGTLFPKFDLIEGECTESLGVLTKAGSYFYLDSVVRVYPPAKPVRETVTIGGKTYYKDELAAALANIKPID